MNQNKLAFETENLQVDFLTLKFQFLDYEKQLEIANYLFTFGFNSSQESDTCQKCLSHHSGLAPLLETRADG